jgi:photosystem II stability/assembly factor-like uncharacterized protein
MNIPRLVYCLTIVIAFRIQVEYTQAQQAFWQQTNRGALAGLRVYDLTIGTNGSMYAACTQPFAPQFGIYRSIDAGASWTLTGLQFTSDGTYYLMNSYRSLEVAPTGHLFALNPHDKGIYRSTDNGANWQRLTVINIARGFAVNASGFVFLSTSIGIYRSTDDGSTWSQINNGLANVNVYSLTINSNGIIFAGTDAGTYRSTDNGTSWTGGGSVSVYSLANSPTSGNLLAGTSSGVYRSSDNGQNWTNVGSPNLKVPVVHTMSTGGVFALFEENNPPKQSVYRSSDDGTTWTKVRDGIFISLASSPSAGLFAAADDGGLFRSTDNGNTWVRPLLSDGSILSLASKSDGTLFAATLGNYVFRTTNAGNSWTQLINGLTNNLNIAVAVNSKGYVFIGTDSSGIFRSTDNGQTWTNTGNGLGNNTHVFAFAVNSTRRILAGCNPASNSAGGVYASTNDGSQWTPLTATTGNVYSLSLASAGKILAGTGDGKVYVSTDTGATWTNSKLTNTTVRSLAISPEGNIFAGTDYPGGLYRSTDNGSTWTNVGFANVSVTSILIKPAVAFLGTYGQGIYRSTNNGVSWAEVNDGLKDYNVLSLALDSAGYLYAGTPSSGIFRSNQALITSVQEIASEVPGRFLLRQNYPNPFNPATTIEFSIPHSDLVTLKVFGLLGEEVATLVNKMLSAGTHRARWDATGVPSGVYFYRLQASDFTETKKLILLR